jgi:hypothetical protein
MKTAVFWAEFLGAMAENMLAVFCEIQFLAL